MNTQEYLGLTDFFYKFLPQGEEKFFSFIKNKNYLNLNAEQTLKFYECYFNEAIHYFKKALCQEQKNKCLSFLEEDWLRGRKKPTNTWSQIFADLIESSPIPKINELND